MRSLNKSHSGDYPLQTVHRRLAVDVHNFPGIFQGSRTFVSNLYKAISVIRPDIDIITFGSNTPPNFPHANHIPIDLSSPVKRLIFGLHAFGANSAECVAHYQYFCPIFSKNPSCITVHDILPITHPQYFPLSFRVKFERMLVISISRARYINTVSKFTRDALVDRFNINKTRIAIVPNGVDAAAIQSIATDKARFVVARDYNLKEYVIVIGRIELRKNLSVVVEAVEQMRAKNGPGLQIVVVGSIDTSSGDKIKGLEELLMKPWVRHFQGLNDSEMYHLLRAAILLVFPSKAEGFGIPPLEAMAAEIPAVVADATAHGELYKGVADMFSPDNPSELARKLQFIIDDPNYRDSLIRNGNEFAKNHSWSESARAFCDSLKI